ncbi:hypothetical protein JTB14_021513 [Gonioctena quinquepunctata]|nr:hypothetical protein JTB14_021513 [Gonioctena quinquepunctata]
MKNEDLNDLMTKQESKIKELKKCIDQMNKNSHMVFEGDKKAAGTQTENIKKVYTEDTATSERRIPNTKKKLTSFIKHNALLDQILEGVINLTKVYGRKDYVIIMSGLVNMMKGVDVHESVTDILKQISLYTNIIVLSVPLWRNRIVLNSFIDKQNIKMHYELCLNNGNNKRSLDDEKHFGKEGLVIVLNVQSLIPKFDEIHALIIKNKPFAACLGEVRLTEEIGDNEIFIDGYQIIRVDSDSRHTGGVLVYLEQEVKILNTKRHLEVFYGLNSKNGGTISSEMQLPIEINNIGPINVPIGLKIKKAIN